MAGYVQDDWKPTARLTLNLGLRYEIQTGPYSNRVQPGGQAAPWPPRASRPRRKNDTNNFGPRVGFAYDVNGRRASSSCAAATGRYYDEIFQNITLYEKWSQIRPARLNFVHALAVAVHARTQYAANRDAIRARASWTRASPGSRSAHHGPRPGAALRRTTFNVGFSVAPADDAGLRRRLRPLDRQGRDRALAGSTPPQNVNTRLSPAGVFDSAHRAATSSRATAATRSSTASTSPARYRTPQGAGPRHLRLDEGQEHVQRLPHPAQRHHERQLGARLRPAPNDIRHRVTWARCSSCRPTSRSPRPSREHGQAVQRPGRPRRPQRLRARHRSRPRARSSRATRSARDPLGTATRRQRRPGLLHVGRAALEDVQARQATGPSRCSSRSST